MSAYADTGFICSVLAPDGNSRSALERMQKQALPLAWTWLHELEFRNAMRLRVFRKELSQFETDRTIRQLLSDLAIGVFERLDPFLSLILAESETLSAGHSAVLGTRSLDVLHVGAALVLGVGEFLTFDKRQSELAKAAGLRVPKL